MTSPPIIEPLDSLHTADSRLLESLLEALYEGIAIVDAEGRPLHWSPAAEKLLGSACDGLSPEEWPERYGLFLADGSRPCPPGESPLSRALAGEDVEDSEFLVRRGGKAPIWLSISARPLRRASGELEGAVLVIRDVSRRKKVEENLRESQERLGLLNQISTTITSGMSVQRVIALAVEPIAENFPQYRVSYSIVDGEGQRRVLHAREPDGLPAVSGSETDLSCAPGYLAELRVGQQVSTEDVTRDPRTAPLAGVFDRECTRARLDEPFYHSEKLIGVLSLEAREPHAWSQHESLTLRQTVEYLSLAINDARAQEERRWAEQALRRSNEELQAFAHSISHDLKAPLRAIQGFSEALVEDYGHQLDADAHRYLSFIADGATRMGELIEDLLQHARLGRGGVTLAPVDMAEVAARVVQSLTHPIAESKAEVRIAPDLPTVTGHRATLELMLQNLVTNALKFVAEGQAPEIEISARRDATCHRITVRDRGIGIDPKYHDGIFDIFHRLHSTSAYPGTGIGLAIVRKGAVLHGGSVEVESHPGEGSSFTFTLPLEPQAGPAP